MCPKIVILLLKLHTCHTNLRLPRLVGQHNNGESLYQLFHFTTTIHIFRYLRTFCYCQTFLEYGIKLSTTLHANYQLNLSIKTNKRRLELYQLEAQGVTLIWHDIRKEYMIVFVLFSLQERERSRIHVTAWKVNHQANGVCDCLHVLLQIEQSGTTFFILPKIA